MKTTTAARIRKTIIFVISFGLLLTGMSLSKTLYARQPALYIWNNSGIACTASYFSNQDGTWANPITTLKPAKLIHSNLNHNKLYHNAVFHVIVGRKLGKFYCTATIELQAFAKGATLLSHEGNCHYTHTHNGQLAMVIDPATSHTAKNLLSNKPA